MIWGEERLARRSFVATCVVSMSRVETCVWTLVDYEKKSQYLIHHRNSIKDGSSCSRRGATTLARLREFVQL